MTEELRLAFSDQILLQDYIWKCQWKKLRWTWKQRALTVSHVIFPFVSSLALVFCFKNWLSYLSHAISAYLHGNLVNWRTRLHFSFSCTVLPRIVNVLIYMNRVFQLVVFANYILCLSYINLYHTVFVSTL